MGSPTVLADLYPVTVHPWPDGVPMRQRVRGVVTDTFLTLLWEGPNRSVGRLDIPLQDSPDPSVRTGAPTAVGEYIVGRGRGCGCGGRGRFRTEAPWPGI